jgi:hypothetical protein
MSKTNFTSVPFTIDENFSRFAGVGKFSPAGIVLEFEGRIFGVIKNGVKEVRFALDDILDVKFKKGFLKRGACIEIRLKSFAKLNEMPNRDGKITLKLERDDFERAAGAVLKLQKDLSEYQEIESPTHTPISRLFDDDDFEMKDLEK